MGLTRLARWSVAAAAALALAACATVRPDAEGPPATPATPPAATTPEAAVRTAEVPAAAPAADAEPDLWQRLRERFAFAACDESSWPDRQRARAIGAQLAQVLPRLALVESKFADAAVPGEFVLLPLVESGYRAVPAPGGGPAGPWQFMPRTARAYGLPIGADYDARLDFVASTDAALRLLADLGRSFGGDWMLANMAFNAGEFRVRRALRAAGGSHPPHSRLRLSPITHQHLARLVAAACVVRDPGRYDIELPQLADDARLVALANEAPLDRDLAAALAAMTPREFDALNAGPRRDRIPAGVHILVPQAVATRLQEGLAQVPPAARRDWHLRRRATPADFAAAARAAGPGIDAALLQRLNAGRDPAAGLLLPGAPTTAAAPVAHGVATGDRYVVRRGDSPWTIARRFRVALADLLAWNDLVAGAILRPGQVVRIAAP